MPFQVLKVDGHPVAAATKDTVELGPMGSAEVLVKADNPGTWLFHCHNLEHMMNGLATLIRVQ
jgi:FtsP/CotA-like multicopper oxidase with cupredoxin domain